VNTNTLVAAVATAALVLSAVSLQMVLYRLPDMPECTTTITKTVTATVNREETGVHVVESRGWCGVLEQPSLEIVEKIPSGDGYIVTLVFRESASNPCHAHYLVESFMATSYPPRLYVTLGLKATAEVCVQCVGLVETVIRTDVLPAGTVIVVNGLSVVV
jgi:hypothetical protein